MSSASENFLRREWIETTGDGGFASSSCALSHQRRYHGIYTAADDPDEERSLLLARLDEVVSFGNQRFELGERQFVGGAQPAGASLLKEVRRSLFVEWTYSITDPFQGDLILKKKILGDKTNRTILISYLLETDRDLYIEFEPFCAFRNFHSLHQEGEGELVEVECSDGMANFIASDGGGEFSIRGADFEWTSDPHWYRDFYYAEDESRGYDATEDLYRPGILQCLLRAGEELFIEVGRDLAEATESPKKHFVAELHRRSTFAQKLPVVDSISSALALATDQFLVEGSSGSQIVAGYPWFTVWGRDTMISLPGITLVTGRHEEAHSILEDWSMGISQGMIPNRLYTREGQPDYNTVDATLWFVQAAYRYYCYTKDLDFVRGILAPAVKEVIDVHRRGTRYDIVQDQDGLLSAGDPSTQLTWMDASYDGVPITPRYGKPVEVNALWLNALYVSSIFSDLIGEEETAEELRQELASLKQTFVETFWCEKGYLYDCVLPDGPDDSIRPNQIIALSLSCEILEQDMAHKVLDTVTRHLLTPMGLRTLSPEHPDYRATYTGTLEERDAAYHQGTVWPWLMGPYITALIKHGDSEAEWKARELIEGLYTELQSGATLGSIPEIYDGDSPHKARGATAQAWSVAELLRCYIEDVHDIKPESIS